MKEKGEIGKDLTEYAIQMIFKQTVITTLDKIVFNPQQDKKNIP